MGRVDVVLSPRPGGFTKVCVLKRMLPELRTPEQETRFRREASIALRMSHGAIAQTLDVVEVDGELCLLQEFIHGTTLAHLEQRAAGANERLPVPLAIHVASEIARALAYAHSFDGGGVIHRDVTPDNIMLSFSGEPKLVDFGIAKSVAEQPLTEVGMVVGRPIYTAPEILAGRDATPLSDVYSLGVVLWQALAGQMFPDVLLPGVEPAAAPSRFNPAVDHEIDALVLRAISLRPEERYRSAADFQDALVACLPRGYLPSKELASYLERHFNVDRERRQLSADIERAKQAVAGGGSGSDALAARGASAPPPRERRLSVRSFVAGALAATAVAALAVPLGVRRLQRRIVADHTEPAPRDPPASTSTPPPRSAELVPTVAAAPEPDHTSRTRRAGRSTDHPVPTRNSAALLRDADRSFKSGDFSAALTLARQAVRDGAGGEANLLMGRIFYARNQLAEAEAEFVRAQQADQPEAGRYLDLVREDRRRARE
jgi:serine/threonine protein kinase